MKNYRFIVGINSLFLLVVILLTLGAVFSGSSVKALFLPPVAPLSPDERLLTYTFQILCSVPVMVCAFSWGLLRTLQPGSKQNKFILCSALVTAGFLLNEIFRIHVILLEAGIPKLTTVLVYAIIAFSYGLGFRRNIRSTPYFMLVTGLTLLTFAIVIDSLHLGSSGIYSLLEGVPKLFSELNIALYFWYICHREVMRSLKHSRNY